MRSKGPSQKYLEANEVKYFSLLPSPPPLSQKWNSVLLLASFYDGRHKHEANFCGKSEIVIMKSPTPSPLVKNISLHWLQGIFETVPNQVVPCPRTITGLSYFYLLMRLTSSVVSPSLQVKQVCPRLGSWARGTWIQYDSKLLLPGKASVDRAKQHRGVCLILRTCLIWT